MVTLHRLEGMSLYSFILFKLLHSCNLPVDPFFSFFVACETKTSNNCFSKNKHSSRDIQNMTDKNRFFGPFQIFFSSFRVRTCIASCSGHMEGLYGTVEGMARNCFRTGLLDSGLVVSQTDVLAPTMLKCFRLTVCTLFSVEHRVVTGRTVPFQPEEQDGSFLFSTFLPGRNCRLCIAFEDCGRD